MTRIVIEDTWYVQPDELGAMVQDALSRVPVELLDVDGSSFSVERFSANHGEDYISTEGVAEVTASLCQREGKRCRVEFETMGTTSSDGRMNPMEVSVTVIEAHLPT